MASIQENEQLDSETAYEKMRQEQKAIQNTSGDNTPNNGVSS